GALFGIALIAAIFMCVTLHELGHSLVAQRFGATVREIVLLPIGGMARLVREPSRPLHELLVAVAGPMVNVVIAAALVLLLGIDLSRLSDQTYLTTLESLFEAPEPTALLGFLLVGNVSLAVFNMFPAFPMDGGRVLRALLSFGLGKSRATAVATRVGQVLAVGLVVLALAVLQNPMLALIGVLVFFGASQEKQMGRAGEVLVELSAGDVCDTQAAHLSPRDDLGDVIDHALRSGQALFPVVYGSELMGIVIRDEAVHAASRLGLRASVREVMRRNLPIADVKVPLMEVRSILADSGLPVVITEDQRFVGVIGMEDLSRIVSLAARLSAAGIRRPGQVPLAPEISASRSPPAAGG
ncbi:MAG TPA: site-2 protease family protein, partial [Polyangiaceae bacterium]